MSPPVEHRPSRRRSPRQATPHPSKEASEPAKRVVSNVLQLIFAAILLVTLVLIVEYVTNPRVRFFDFLYR